MLQTRQLGLIQVKFHLYLCLEGQVPASDLFLPVDDADACFQAYPAAPSVSQNAVHAYWVALPPPPGQMPQAHPTSVCEGAEVMCWS